MTAADRELSGVVRQWLAPGTTSLSDRVFASAMTEIATTPQRHRPRALRRWRALPPTTRFALVGSAAVAIVAMVGIGLLATRPGPNIGPTVPTQRAIPSLTDRRPEPSSSLAPSPASGRVVIDAIEGLVISFDVPPGWSKTGEAAVGRPVGRYAPKGPDGVEVSFSDIERIYQYPCTSPENSKAFGTTTADLAAALQPVSEYDHTDPVDTTLAGHPGQRLEITLPDDLGDCHPGGPILWTSSGQPTRSGLPGERDRLWVLDVEGIRLLVDAMAFAGTSAQDLAAQQRLIDSIRIERVRPVAEPPSPTPFPESSTTVINVIDGLRISYDLPEGWTSYHNGAHPPGQASINAEVDFGTVDRVWQYPCRMPYLSNKSLAGTTPADLVAKLRSAEGYTSTKAADIDFAGYRGKRIQLRMPGTMADCNGFMTEYFVWIGAPLRYGLPDQRDDLRILDVDGIRLVIDAMSFPDTTAETLAAQQRLIDSVRIERIDSPSPSPSPSSDQAPSAGSSGRWEAIDGLQITFDLPPGWSQPEGTGSTDRYPTPHVQGPNPGVAVNFYDEIDRVMPRPPAGPGVGPQDPGCRLPYGGTDDAGATPADLAAKLQSDPHIAATKPVDVTLSGFNGKRLELQIPDPVSDCYLSSGVPLWIGRPTGFAGAGQRDTVWVLDVRGTRMLIEAVSFPGTSAEDLVAQQRLIESIRITPTTP